MRMIKFMRAIKPFENKLWNVISKDRVDMLINYLYEHPCIDCGEANILVLEFDHVRGIKKFSISNKSKTMCIDRVKDEIEKCDIRCANCHRIISLIPMWQAPICPTN